MFMSLMLAMLTSCSSPHDVDVTLNELPPETKSTSFSEAIRNLGKMTIIYNSPQLNIMAKEVGDVTGTSASTGAEIPRDITEMVKSALNAVGGGVVFIPYDPSFFQNTYATGYSTFENKIIPNVVLTGAITEFDRGLETKGKGTDFEAEASVSGLPKWVPSNRIGFESEDASKTAVSRITLDFNLIDFNTLSGIARMQAVNSIKVDKATAKESIGFSLLGPTIGLKGEVKKVQGRHAAVRLLVELSVIQIVGKYLALPYWGLVPGAQQDPIVLDAITTAFYSWSDPVKNIKTQELLFLHGYDVPFNGLLDAETKAALQKFDNKFSPESTAVNRDLYANLYLSVPITDETLGRRQKITQIIQQQMQATAAPQEQTPQETAKPLKKSAEKQAAPAQEEAAATPKERKLDQKLGVLGGGRVLSDKDF